MIVWCVIALIVAPLVVLRGRTLLAFYATAATIALFAWIVERRLLEYDPRLGFIVVAVLELAALSLFIANGSDVRWSANRAALVAAIVYALAIPAMLRTPIDGDEPFYLLLTESIVHDGDLDLANQYREQNSASGRTDLVPQFGDPTGPGGAQYSRHEPFLSLLMAPGYALGGLPGAVAVIALFGVLLVRSTVRWMEDEGVSADAARAVFPLFAFGPPVLFYATRIWPEVPAAFCYVEALRGIRNQRIQRWLPALFGLVMLKLRFVLVAVGIVGVAVRRAKARRSTWIALAIIAVPMAIAFLITGSATNVHSWREIIPTSPMKYVVGLLGLLADGMGGIAFQAPFYLLGLFAITRWSATPRGFRIGLLASVIYVFYLLPRPEWYGGWAPPLRYVVFLMPVLALGAASVWDRVSRGAIALVAAATVGLVIHGVAHPWHLFHIADGENSLGEWLSQLYHADFSRVFPSFVRINEAAWIGAAVVILVIFLLRRTKVDLVIPLVALAIAFGFNHARRPAALRVDFEDAHVLHKGGKLYPEQYTMMRQFYRGGWVLEAGDSASLLAAAGKWKVHFITGLGATIDVAGRAYQLPKSDAYQTITIEIPRSGRVTLRCLSGAVNIDRMDHE